MDQVLGQPRAIADLQAALRSGRVHHAFIFHGPAGVGKFTAALRFARTLLCHDPQTRKNGDIVACGKCESCRLIDNPPPPQPAGTKKRSKAASENDDESDDDAIDFAPELMSPHPDLHLVIKELARYSDDKSTRQRKLLRIPVEVLETHLITPAHRSAQLRHNKVFIVDEAELVDPIGQNKLLKTLEEPPAGTYIILVTANEDRLLPTIRSRCQRVAFGPLDEAAMAVWMDRHGLKVSASQKTFFTALSGGSPGRAVLAAEYRLDEWAKEIVPLIEQMRQGKLAADLGKKIATHIDNFAKTWVESHANASKEAANRMGAALMWSMIAQLARRRLADAAATVKSGEPDAAEDATRPWLAVIDALNTAESELYANINPGLVCEHLASLLYRALSPPPAQLALR